MNYTQLKTEAPYLDTPAPIYDSKSYDLVGFLWDPRLPDTISSLPDSLVVDKCPYFKDVTFATISSSRCDMIVGTNRADLMQHLEVRDAGPQSKEY